jgi:hypothetical protein
MSEEKKPIEEPTAESEATPSVLEMQDTDGSDEVEAHSCVSVLSILTQN